MEKLSKPLTYILVIGAMALTIAAVAFACDAYGGSKFSSHHQGHHKGMMESMAKHLDLTDEQRKQMKALRMEISSKKPSRHEQRSEVLKLIDAGNVDQAAETAAQFARDKVYGMAAKKKQMAEILTPEQLEKMKAFQQRKMSRLMKKRMEKGDHKGERKSH